MTAAARSGRAMCYIAIVCITTASFGGVSTAPASAPMSGAPTGADFVTIVNGEFTIGCKVIYPAIWNQWEVVESGAGAPTLYGASLPPDTTGPQLIRTLMDQAVSSGLTVMRAWASTVDASYALETAPGIYNEAVFRGLDYALDQARQRNIRVILALIDYWQGGVQQFVEWMNDPAITSNDFFTNTKMMQWYKDWLKVLVSRVNTINGRVYAQDPTIFAWDLINEPRCSNCNPGTIAAWISEMAAYLKKLDPNHLVTTGEDGFYSTTSERVPANPVYEPDGTPWAQNEGQDFIADHSSPDIDFATFHSWVDNWQAVREDFQRSWVDVHAYDATYTLKKPVILEEFGKWGNTSVTERNDFFSYAFDESNEWINNGSALKGIGFWELFAPGQEAPATEGGGEGLYGITTSDSTWAIITQEMTGLTQASDTSVQGCTPAPAPLQAVRDCSSTEVDGMPGTGYEGPQCNVDINECVRGVANCGSIATCVNTPGAFQCTCWAGFTGDGMKCSPTAQLSALESQYTQDAIQGPLICDVPYPQNAPGFLYDPTGSIYRTNQDDVGSPGPVNTLLDCLIACESAPGCSVAVYSATSFVCLLKGCPLADSVTCAALPPPGQPGSQGGPPLPPPSPPAPPAPPCTLPPSLCPSQNATFKDYYSNLRYNPECTEWSGNPGIAYAPAPAPGKITVQLPPGLANNISTLSTLGPAIAAVTAADGNPVPSMAQAVPLANNPEEVGPALIPAAGPAPSIGIFAQNLTTLAGR